MGNSSDHETLIAAESFPLDDTPNSQKGSCMKTKYLKIRSSLIAMAAVALVTAMTGSTVQAVLVLANGATNFYDNFDSAPDVVGNPPVNGPVGGWSNVESSPGFTRVTNGPPTGI